MPRLVVLLLAALAAGSVPAADSPQPPAPRETAPLMAPSACVCSPPTPLAGPGRPDSELRNCQCGALQCVVHVQSGRMSCH